MLLGRVKEAFAETEEIERIEVVPSSFVTPAGGFDNLEQIRSALGIDLIVLISFEQTQFDDANVASITYWTIVGAYVVPGNENETHTLVHASVFDIESEVLLLNASGTSVVEDRTTAVNLERALREDRLAGFAQVGGQVGMARPEGAGRPLPMDVNLAGFTVHPVAFHLAGVVRDVEQQGQAGRGEEAGEHVPGQAADDLPVGQGAIDGRPHGTEIALA